MPLLLSQNLRNYFHHVASLKTHVFHRKRRKAYIANSNKELIEDLKKDGAYSGINGETLRDLKLQLINFKWDVELSMLSHKTTVLYECGETELGVEDFEAFKQFINNEIAKRPEPTLTDHEKVLRYLDYKQKREEFSLRSSINSDYYKIEPDESVFSDEFKESFTAYKNWVSADFDPPDMGF